MGWCGRVQRGPVQETQRPREACLSRLGPMGGEVGSLRRAGPRPVRFGCEGQLFQRRRLADGAARVDLAEISRTVGLISWVGESPESTLGFRQRGVERMERRVIPHGYDMRLIIGLTIMPLLVVASLALILPLLQRNPSAEANSAMLASPAPIDGKRAFGYLKQICALG